MAKPVVVGIGEVLWDVLPGGKQLGGAPANFAYHANALGAEGVVVSRVGDDDPGREILARLDALALDRSRVSTDPRYTTGRVDVRVDGAGVPEYVIHAPAAWDFIPLDAPLLDAARRADAVCFGSLAQRSPLSRESIRQFLRVTRPTCLRVFDINLRQAFYSRQVLEDSLRACDVLKLNDAELPVVARVLHVVGEPIQSPALSTARALLDRYPLRLVAFTRGHAGSLLLARGGETSDHPGIPVPRLADTVGAGDAFTAALVMGLMADRDLDAINAAANRLAAYVCTQPGATPPIPAALAAEVRG
jgi:fructokinase